LTQNKMEFASLSNSELAKVQEAEKSLNQKKNEEIILLAYKKE